jgi:hypothetical protein
MAESADVDVGESKCPQGGRGLFAVKAFEPRDLLFTESALAAEPSTMSAYRLYPNIYCSHCFRFVCSLEAHMSVLSQIAGRAPPSQVTFRPPCLTFQCLSPFLDINR